MAVEYVYTMVTLWDYDLPPFLGADKAQFIGQFCDVNRKAIVDTLAWAYKKVCAALAG